MATSNTLYEEKLREKPTLDELCEHVNIGTKWYTFGVLLKLDITKLNAIEELNRDVDVKTLKMFQLWLNTNPEAMRMQIVDALKKEVIGVVTLAEKYEKILRESCVITTEPGMDQEMSKIVELRIKLDTLNNQKTAEIEQLQFKLKQKEVELHSVKETLTQKQLDINELKQILKGKEETLETLGETLKNEQVQMSKLKYKLKTQHTINREMKIEVDSLKSTIRQIENARDNDEKEYLSVLAKILEENEMLKETVRSLISQLQEKEEQNFQLKSTRGRGFSSDSGYHSSSMLSEELDLYFEERHAKTTEVKESSDHVKWYGDGVDLISPTIQECEEVVSIMKKQQKYWKIYFKTSSPDSVLNVLCNLNDILVRGLDIRDTPLDSCCISELSHLLTYNKTMEYLRILSSPLPPKGLEMITNALSTNTTLKSLGFWHDLNITDEDIPHISTLLSGNKTLEELRLYSCSNITELGRQQLSEVLNGNKTILTLYVNNCFLR